MVPITLDPWNGQNLHASRSFDHPIMKKIKGDYREKDNLSPNPGYILESPGMSSRGILLLLFRSRKLGDAVSACIIPR